MATEALSFCAHKNLLYSVIQSQAGTLQKALLEGVMNSIDAGATRVAVQLHADRFSLSDDGRGFQSRDEVVNWFGQFGTPHRDGDAVYGRFRMGRGQLFAFGVNVWRTGVFRMEVDVREKGLDYALTSALTPVKGCKVEGRLYQPLEGQDLETAREGFAEFVRYAQIPVSLNGRVVSRRPQDCEWDLDTPDAYIKLRRTGNLKVYNLGVLVREYDGWEHGCGGIVVSKHALTVNFARNDILAHQCEVWNRVRQHLRALNLRQLGNKGALTPDERQFLARNLLHARPGTVDIERSRLFTDATGKHVSLAELRQAQRVCVAEDKELQRGARLHRQGNAFVLSQDTLRRFGVSDFHSLAATIARVTGQPLGIEVDDFDELAKGVSDEYRELAASALSVPELLAFAALKKVHPAFFKWFAATRKTSGERELRVGESQTREAWTDGRQYIVLNRTLLERAASRGAPGFYEALVTLVHEYVHDESDAESHDHDMVFYREHHDVMQYRSGRLLSLVQEATRNFERAARKSGLEPAGGLSLRAPASDTVAPRIEGASPQAKLF